MSDEVGGPGIVKTSFIVGAGFSAAANALVGSDEAIGYQYPLVKDLASYCFDSSYDISTGVEEAFLQALKRKDNRPLKLLVEVIEGADYYIGTKVGSGSSVYTALLERFPRSTFLSFNYDGLLELLLHKRGEWTPVDGFGVEGTAESDRVYRYAPPVPASSQARVIHLHGSVYLFPIEFESYSNPGESITWLRATDRPVFRFDPDSLGHAFIPFRSGASGLAYKLPDERLIVPVPDKAAFLAERFVSETYARAKRECGSTDSLVAIGYRFASYDRSSYQPLLTAYASGGGRSVHIVAPDASEIAARLESEHTSIHFVPVPSFLSEWAADDFTLDPHTV